MRSFDDLTPEQLEERHEALVELLKGTYRTPELITPLDEASAIARVRARLAESAASQRAEALQTQTIQAGSLAAPLQRPVTRRRPKRLISTMNALAAVLIIALLAGSSLILFKIYFPPAQSIMVSQPAPIAYTSAHVEINGLELTFHLSPGPYFISQLVLADASITNHTSNTFTLFGMAGASACGSAVYVMQSEGSAPHYELPIAMTHSCPLMSTTLHPGQTITTHQYTPLSGSGHITLTERVAYNTSDTNSSHLFKSLEGHWPSIPLYVNAQIPPDHTLSLKRVGKQITVTAPAAAKPLLYAYDVSCADPQGPGTMATGNYVWGVQPTPVIEEPNCSNKNVHWDYAVAAVGYAIASGSADFP